MRQLPDFRPAGVTFEPAVYRGCATWEVPGSQPDTYDGRVWHYTARMLNFTNVALRRGPRKLLDDVSLTIYPGWKLGVVGRNGTGKSSLFALVLGQLATDRGEVSRRDSRTRSRTTAARKRVDDCDRHRVGFFFSEETKGLTTHNGLS